MKIILTYLFTLCFFLLGFATNDYESPFNGKSVKKDTSNYSFFVSGHFYGSDQNKSGLPANTLLGNLDWINEQQPHMVVSLGDLFKDINSNIPNYQRTLFDRLNCPLVNTVGNHDISGTKYQDEFGETSFSFEVANDIHIILDTEKNNGDLDEQQVGLIKSANRAGLAYTNIFIYTHRTIWKDSYTELENMFQDNTQALTGNNFTTDVKPLIEELAENSKVYWMSGSMGSAPASFFHFESEKVTFIATAIRELPRDAILKVNVNGFNTTFETCSLTGQELEELKFYNLDYWNSDHTDEPFNFGLFAYKVELMLTHRYFWLGALWTGVGILFVVLFMRWRKKRKLLKPF